MRQVAVASLILTFATPAPALHAQLRASEQATVSQTIDGTTITIDYSRPRARGRTGLFGTRIKPNEVWTPGANQATTLKLNKDVRIDGNAVPKGKYSVWIFTDPAQWTLVLDPDTMRFHTQHPHQQAGQVRFPIQRQKRPFMEMLTWWFPEVGASGATLAMQWDTVYVPLRVAVSPSYTTGIAPDVAKRIAGSYELRFEPPPPGAATGEEDERPPEKIKFTIRQTGNELRGVMEPPLYSSEEGYRDWIVVPMKGGWFTLGRYDKGELVELFDYFQLQFEAAGKRAASFEVRLPNDALVARGSRID